MFYEVIPEGKVEALTYSYIPENTGVENANVPASLAPGQIVLVPLGRKTVPGVVLKEVKQPDFKTKPIAKVLYETPLPQHLLATAQFIHDYYLAATGSAISLILPNGVEKKRRQSRSAPTLSPSNPAPVIEPAITTSPITLNPAQKQALAALQKAPGATKLLFGVTGSGKTNIYLKLAENALEQQKSTILLVPEIALTGQLVRVFQEVFGDKITLIHSQQTEAERHLIFNSLLEPETPAHPPRIIIGPRSALFAPVYNLGLIIIDEAHESTYYQENSPKYSALRVASFMAKNLNISLILGSATPTLEDFYLAEQKSTLVKLTQKAKKSALKPEITVIDFKDRNQFIKNRYFSSKLLKAIADNLKQSRQTLIFHNRRGSSSLTVCESCGEELLCPHCFLPLTLHADSFQLVCHTCGFSQIVPTVCPKCGTPGIVHKGFGTKLIETELKKLFPQAKIQRFDADNKKDEGMAAVYDEVREGGVDILVGTQTLAKGLDLPKLATVGVVQADAGLALPDFAAEERVFQLLTQVIGRVGRGHTDKAEVFIQTFRPEHPVIAYAIAEDYLGFAEYLTKRRREGGFPPFKFILRLEITMKTEAIALRKIRDLAQKLAADKKLLASPPTPAFHERTDKGYTWQIVVRSRSRQALLAACENLDKNFKITLDPPSLL